jgi:hypothetical protein
MYSEIVVEMWQAFGMYHLPHEQGIFVNSSFVEFGLCGSEGWGVPF